MILSQTKIGRGPLKDFYIWHEICVPTPKAETVEQLNEMLLDSVLCLLVMVLKIGDTEFDAYALLLFSEHAILDLLPKKGAIA